MAQEETQSYNLQYTAAKIDDLLEKIDSLTDATQSSAGLMSSSDKTKLDGIEQGAEANVIEGVSLAGVALTPEDKIIDIPVDSEPTQGSSNPISSGAVADALEEGNFPDFSAGFTACLYDRRSAGTPQSPYTFRQSGGDGVDYLKRIKGRTLVWNQLLKLLTTPSTVNDVTFTPLTGGKFKVQGTASANISTLHINNNDLPGVAGHKYFIYGPSTANDGFYIYFAGPNIYASGGTGIYTCTTPGSTSHATIRCNSGAVLDWEGYVFIVDLTLMFGAGNEPTTVEQFRALHPLPYYNYNAGVLKNNAATDLESTGFNQWDEVAEEGNISTTDGQDVPFTGLLRTKNYIPVIAGGNYYFRISAAQKPYRLYYYDAAKNYLGYITWQNSLNITIPSDTYYIRFVLDSSYGTTYNHDICINLSDPDRNGTYEPYWKATRHLGLDSIQAKEVGSDTIVTINGLDGVGDNVDLLKEGKTLIKNRARVDLGSLNWSYDANNTRMVSNIADIKVYSSLRVTPMQCSRYFCVYDGRAIGNVPDKAIYGANSTAIYVKDSAYTDPAAFKTAMAGVMLDYPLATPKEYELVEPIQPMLEVDELGTERRLPEDTADAVNAPFESDSNYSVSVANLVRKLSE